MLFECWMMNTAWLTFPQHEVKFYLSLYCTSVLYNCALQCPSLWLNLIWIYDILYYCTVLSLLSHFLAMSFYYPGYIVQSWWCVTLGYCIIMVAGLGGWPWRPVDPTIMFPMLISLILMCHTWLLHHHSGWPWRLTVKASGPHHYVSHVGLGDVQFNWYYHNLLGFLHMESCIVHGDLVLQHVVKLSLTG